MIQGKLGSLVGRSSGYIENLPTPVRRRVAGLKGVQKEHAKIEAQFQEEVLQLEKKYFAKFTPLYQKRAQIVNGSQEPSEEEVKAGEPEDEDQMKTEDDESKGTSGQDLKGIPEFWLSAMKNQVSLAEMITDRDEAALKFLTDIRMEYLDRPGFRLIFEFAENEFFTNKTITKTYFYQEDTGYAGDFIYDHAEGDKIEWNSGKDLTVRVESKKQRNKSKCNAWLMRNHLKLISPKPPSRPVLSRRPCLLSRSSTSSPLQLHPAKMTRKSQRRTLRSALSLITSWVRTSKRSSFLVPSIGSPVKLYNSRNSTKILRKANLRMKMKRTMMM